MSYKHRMEPDLERVKDGLGSKSNSPLGDAEHAIFHAGQRLTDAVWDQYVKGELSSAELIGFSSLLSGWIVSGERLLKSIFGGRDL
ncbi:MAG: hypothetical protein WBG80_09375 [Bacteroidota bacterium]